MLKGNRLLLFYIGSGFLFVLDRVLKFFARTNPDATFYLWKPYLGWEYFGNTGIALSLPFPNWLLVGVTPVILLGLVKVLMRAHAKGKEWQILGLILILFGAMSNFIDRALFDVTVDYLRIYTSVINIADVMIAVGVVLLLKIEKNKK